MALPAGTRLGPYEIQTPIGAGGMGEVYQALDTRLDRTVAVKVLPAHLASDPEALARFEREAKAVAALSHPNILSLHDFGTHEGLTYAVAELLAGETLRERLASGPLPHRKAADYAAQVAMGLAAAHEKGVVHRDLKPENLFLTPDGRVKILDFGLARQRGIGSSPDATSAPTQARPTEPGTILGTVGYMSPEQVRGHEADHRSDLFSLGCVLYEMVTGRRAFQRETAAETMTAILREDPPDPATLQPGLPPNLERAVRHCLEKSPNERFQSARDLAFALGETSGSSSSAARAGAAAPLATVSRRAWIAAASTVALGAAFEGGRRLGMARAGAPLLRTRRLTFRRGNLLGARFTPDTRTVVYGAAWEETPVEIFTVAADGGASRPMALHADLLGVSSRGELAVLRTDALTYLGGPVNGTLARVPQGGGAPRDVLVGAVAADWSPNGEELAVVRRLPDGTRRLEYPIGHALYESSGLAKVRVSPDGRHLALTERGGGSYNRLVVVEAATGKAVVSREWAMVSGMAWSPSGREVWVSAADTPDWSDLGLRRVDLSGVERVVINSRTVTVLHDLAADGRVLVEGAMRRTGLLCRPPGEDRERELGWLDGSSLRTISRDGRSVLFSESWQGRGPRGDVYVRATDGSPAVRLGDGTPMDLSPDGRWALALGAEDRPSLVMLPTGAGQARPLDTPGLAPEDAAFLSNNRVVFAGRQAKGPAQAFVLDVAGGAPRPFALEGLSFERGAVSSPDGNLIAYVATDGTIRIAPLGGGSIRAVPGPPLDSQQGVIGWAASGRTLFVGTLSEIPARVLAVDLANGRRSAWATLQPADRMGLVSIGRVQVAGDGHSYAYSYDRVVASDLFMLEGLPPA